MNWPMPGRYAVRNKLPSTHRDLNQAVEEAAGAAHFVNVSALLCGPQGLCPPFLPDGRLISYDGGHLTKDGARLLGKLLSEHLRGRQFVLQNHRSVSSAALVQSAGAQR